MTEKLIALIEATVLEIYSVDNKLSGYIQWRCLEKEFWNENAKNDRIDWLYPCYVGVLIGIDGRSFLG